MRSECANAPSATAALEAKTQRGISALDSTGELLMALACAGRPLNLRDLAAAAGMPPAKAFPHLVSLQKIGLLARDDNGCFTAGSLSFELGLIALQRISPARDAEPEIASLALSTQLTVAAATLGPLGPTIVRLEESALPQHISLRVGTVMSLVNTAIGRVFASHMSEDVLDHLLEQEPIRLAGAQTKPPLSHGLRERLRQIRADGMDQAIDAPVPGVAAFAAPVLDHTGNVALVIAVIGATAHFDRDPHGPSAQALLAATRRLSWRFGSLGAGSVYG